MLAQHIFIAHSRFTDQIHHEYFPSGRFIPFYGLKNLITLALHIVLIVIVLMNKTSLYFSVAIPPHTSHTARKIQIRAISLSGISATIYILKRPLTIRDGRHSSLLHGRWTSGKAGHRVTLQLNRCREMN